MACILGSIRKITFDHVECGVNWKSNYEQWNNGSEIEVWNEEKLIFTAMHRLCPSIPGYVVWYLYNLDSRNSNRSTFLCTQYAFLYQHVCHQNKSLAHLEAIHSIPAKWISSIFNDLSIYDNSLHRIPYWILNFEMVMSTWNSCASFGVSSDTELDRHCKMKPIPANWIMNHIMNLWTLSFILIAIERTIFVVENIMSVSIGSSLYSSNGSFNRNGRIASRPSMYWIWIKIGLDVAHIFAVN